MCFYSFQNIVSKFLSYMQENWKLWEIYMKITFRNAINYICKTLKIILGHFQLACFLGREIGEKLFCCARIRVCFLFPVVVILSATDERHVSQVEVTEWEANLKQHMFSVFALLSVKLAWCSSKGLAVRYTSLFFHHGYVL